MSEASAPTAPSAPTASGEPAADAPEAWKPEPRQWSWKDLFTAPMLAFKPRCMLVSALAVIVICLWYRASDLLPDDPHPVVSAITTWVWHTVALIIFSLAASLVAVFMKADLLDDEFLTFGEAIAAYRKRLLPALLVPVFLTGLLGGFHVLLLLLGLAFNIPYVGPLVYSITFPISYLLGLFVFLLGIAVVLSVFVFPSIIAIRKHGWFDNVVDTFEAVGTKPHVLVLCLLLVTVLVGVAALIGMGGINELKKVAATWKLQPLMQSERQADEIRHFSLSQVEPKRGGNDLSNSWVQIGVNLVLDPELPPMTPRGDAAAVGRPARDALAGEPTPAPATEEPAKANRFYSVTGAIAGIWQVVISALVLGYCLNLFVGGGMLTYLSVREDDYWDDEDLEDLDQLAKELEEEAKQEAAKEGGTATTAPPPAAVPPAAAAPPAPAAVPPAAPPAAVAVTPAPPAASATPSAGEPPASPPADKPA